MDSTNTDDRDVRYTTILKQQLGENGLSILSTISILFILCLTIIIVTMVSVLRTKVYSGINSDISETHINISGKK